jgi:hypothetical protein
MNSHKDMNSSEYMNSYNDNNYMNSSDYENSYVPPCDFVPDKELEGLTNGHDKSNTLGDMSKMNIDTDCINTDCIDTDCIDTDCINTDSIDAECITKDCIYAKFKHTNYIDIDHTIQIWTVPIHKI